MTETWKPFLPAPGESRMANMALLLLGAYLLVLPVGGTAALRSLLFFSLVGLTLWAAWKKQVRLWLPAARAWGLYLAVALISLTYAVDPLYSAGEIKTEILYGAAVMVMTAAWVRNEARFAWLLHVLLAGNLFLVVCAIFKGLSSPPGGVFQLVFQVGSLNIGVGKFSTYLILVMPFLAALLALNGGRRAYPWLLGLMLANLLALYLTGNRMAYVALAAEAVVFWLILRRHLARPRLGKRGWAVLILLSLIPMLAATETLRSRMVAKPQDGGAYVSAVTMKSDERWELWSFVLQRVAKHPLSGGGFGQEAFMRLEPEFRRTHPLLWHAHNFILNKAVQMGWPGALAFLLLLVCLGRALLVSARVGSTRMVWLCCATGAMLAGMVVKNLTDDFFVRDNAWMVWLLIGAMLGALRDKDAMQ